MTKWTNEQKEAINARGSNLLVSAAAGSGKTTVMVERIIKFLVEDMIDIDRMLVVTFTEAAAGEMKERISQAINKGIEEGKEKEAYFRKQLMLLNRASISTLHSFCLKIIRENFYYLGLDPDFRIGDEGEVQILKQEAIEEVLEEEYRKLDKDFVQLVEGFGDNREDRNLERLILNIYDFIQSRPHPLDWLKEKVEEFDTDVDRFKKSSWIVGLKDYIKIELLKAKDYVNDALKIANMENGPAKYIEALKADTDNIEKLMAALEDLDLFNEEIKGIEYKSLARTGKKDGVDEKLQDKVKDLRNKYKKIIDHIKKDIFGKDIDEYVAEVRKLYPMMKYLHELVASFSEAFSQRKRERGILDYNDLEHYALQVLEDEGIRKYISNRYDYIFVDEYQDINLVQETIIKKIKKDANLFLVGDVKQSIYRFRLADPSLFVEKYENYSTEENSLNRRIDLAKNFRSRDEIIEGVNFIFKNIMSKAFGEIDYDERAYLYKGAEYEKIDDPTIELNILSLNEDKEENQNEEMEDDFDSLEKMELEAAFVANRIKDLIGRKTYNPKTGEYKKIEYRDIVVLLRTVRDWASVYMDTFIKNGIPAYLDDKSGYFDSVEIMIFMDLLRVIDNRRRDRSLISTMRSPIGGFTMDELARIRLAGKKGSYFDAVNRYMEEKDDDLQKKLKDFMEKISYWANEARYLKLDEFIWKLLIETGYYYYVGAMPGGNKRQANMRILVERAKKFENMSQEGLFGFVRFVDRLQEIGVDMGTAKTLGEKDNVVRIMSIHNSKGLEFPIVIVGGLGKGFNLEDTKDAIVLHKDFGLGPRFVDVENRAYCDSLPRISIREKIRLETLSEEMRILYVAFTRAMDKLILVGTVDDIEKECGRWSTGPKFYNLVSGKNFLDWICSSLYIHGDGEKLRNLYGLTINENIFKNTENPTWTIEVLKRTELDIRADSEKVSQNEYMDRLINFKRDEASEFAHLVRDRLDWNYKYEEGSKIPSKIGVTDIRDFSRQDIDRLNIKIPSMLKLPKLSDRAKTFTGAEVGTIVHFVMQHIDLDKVDTEEAILEQIEDMVAKGFISREEAQVVDVKKIRAFFESPIGERMLASPAVHREVPFVLHKRADQVIEGIENIDEKILIQGIIDCYFEEDDHLILLDYKTDFISSDNIEELADKYRKQIEIYKEALEKIKEKEVKESFIYSFNQGKEVKVETGEVRPLTSS